jgi:hypothetical protein
MANGAPVLRRLVRRGRSGLPWCSSWFPAILDAEVDDAETILYLLSIVTLSVVVVPC